MKLSKAKEDVRLTLLRRIQYFEGECGFTSNTMLSEIKEKGYGTLVAFGAYGELLTLWTSLFYATYNTEK